MRRGSRARTTNGPIPPRSSLAISTCNTRHTRSTSCHADRNAGWLGSFSRSLSSFHSSGPLIISLLPGDHLAPLLSPPILWFTTGGGGAGGERRLDASSLVTPGVIFGVQLSSATSPGSAPLSLGPASSPTSGVLAAGGSATAAWTLSSLALLVELAMLQSGSHPIGPVFRSAVAPFVVPSICGGGSCPLAPGLVPVVAALVPSGWVFSSLFLRLLARRSLTLCCSLLSWGRINPVRNAPSSLVELRLASFSAVPSRHDERPSSHGDFGGKRVAGALATPPLASSCSPWRSPFSLASYVMSVILGRFGIAPWSLEMGPNTSLSHQLSPT